MHATKPHPQKTLQDGNLISGSDIIVKCLVGIGVRTIFGYSGGAILPTFDSIFCHNQNPKTSPGKKINLIVPANEQGACFMAAGYARSCGQPGVCIVTSGPGATNTVTPIRDSMADSIPLVLLCGQVATTTIGTDAFQEAPISNIMAACAKHVFLIKNPEDLEATIRTAFYIASSGRKGPVVVDIPKDIQNCKGTFRKNGILPLPGYQSRIKQLAKNNPDKAHRLRFFQYLAKAKRPLVYAGGGVLHAKATNILRTFIERYQIPVVTTLMGIGSVDTTRPLSLGMLGMHGTAYANYATEECDLLIAIGARFDDRVAGRPDLFAPKAKAILHIDIDQAEINKVMHADWSLCSDAKKGLALLMENDDGFRPDYREWQNFILQLKSKFRMNYPKASPLLQPHFVLETLDSIIRGEAIITTGVGQHQMWAAQYLHFKHPRSWLTSGSMGTMGFGLPAAIGAQLAYPDKLVINVDGDASLRMNFGEMETVTTYNLPVKILLINNFGDGMIRQWQKTFFNNRYSASDKSLRTKNFCQAACADGFKFSKCIDKNEQVYKTLKTFVDFPEAAFLEVVIDRDAGVFPMVCPGTGYQQMITGAHIASLNPDRKKQIEEAAKVIKTSDMF